MIFTFMVSEGLEDHDPIYLKWNILKMVDRKILSLEYNFFIV